MPDRNHRTRRSAASPANNAGWLRRAQRRQRRTEASASPDISTKPAVGEPLVKKPVEEPVVEAAVVDEGAVKPARDNRRRAIQSLVRPGRGQVIAAAILFLVGMAGVMQIKINTADDTYSTARREDLIQLLDGLGQEARRLEGEIADLQRTKTNLDTGADTQRVAREEAQKRIEVLSILAGTAPAEGPGITMRITDPQTKIKPDQLLDMVEEMRDAGAEVIEINDSVRVVASTWFGGEPGALVVDDQAVVGPITVEVIGDPHSLSEAAQFRGGIVSEIEGPNVGGHVEIIQVDKVVVRSLHSPTTNQYAQPAAPPPTPR